MEITAKNLAGLLDVHFQPFVDHRGFLIKPFDQKPFVANGVTVEWKQILLQHTNKRNTMKGFHFQSAPFTEAKLITPLAGEVLWVCVDIRPESPTFGQSEATILKPELNKALFAPRGFAHANMSLTDETLLLIAADNHFSEQHGVGFAWNDPDIGFDWPLLQSEVITIKDEHRDNPPFAAVRGEINLAL